MPTETLKKIGYSFSRLRESFARDGLETTLQKILFRIKTGKLLVRQRYFQGQGREPDKLYRLWRENHTLTQGDLAKMRAESSKLTLRPLMSIVVPVYKPDLHFFHRAVQSVREQAYPNWELCLCDDGSGDPAIVRHLQDLAASDSRIKIRIETVNGGIVSASQKATELAAGEFVAFMDQDDLLSEDALFRVAELLNRDPSLDLIYSDNDKIDLTESHWEVYFKPDFSPDEFFCHNYIGHLSVLRMSIFREIGGVLPGFDGAQDFEILLRAIEKTDRVAHLPYVLYSWRRTPGSTASVSSAKQYAYESGKRALEEFFARKHQPVTVEETDEKGLYRCRFQLKDKPKVDVIAVTRKGPKVKIVNDAVKKSTGDYLIFLNEDLKPVKSDWMESLLEPHQRKGVGMVGGKILDCENTIQDGGKILGLGDVVGTAFKGVPDDAIIYNQPHRLIRNASAVSWDALLISRSLFEKIGGFDERVGDSLADIDLCLRVRKDGHLIVWTPFAAFQFKTAAENAVPDFDGNQIFKERWKDVLGKPDPFYNVNLSLRYTDFSPKVDE